MQFEPTSIAGCVIVRPPQSRDDRGQFAKTFHSPSFAIAGLRTDWHEEFYSLSRRNVIRGMHFQRPPADHAKLVFCLAGAVTDVVVDLRAGSPSRGTVFARRLDAVDGAGLYVPSGCAHGFGALEDKTLMLYKVTSVHAPAEDAGIAWNSIGFDWNVADPIVSPRDQAHPGLAAFESPFYFDQASPSR